MERSVRLCLTLKERLDPDSIWTPHPKLQDIGLYDHEVELPIHPFLFPTMAHIYEHLRGTDYKSEDLVDDSLTCLRADDDELNSQLDLLRLISDSYGGITREEILNEEGGDPTDEEGNSTSDIGDRVGRLIDDGYVLQLGSRYYHVPQSHKPILFALALLEKSNVDGVPAEMIRAALALPTKARVEEAMTSLIRRGLVAETKEGYLLADTQFRNEASRRARERGQRGGNPNIIKPKEK